MKIFHANNVLTGDIVDALVDNRGEAFADTINIPIGVILDFLAGV